VQAVQKAGSYQAREEAARAVHAVWSGLKDKLPPDAYEVTELLALREAAHLGRSSAESPADPSALTTPRGRSRATRAGDAGGVHDADHAFHVLAGFGHLFARVCGPESGR
jgi:hypothetical protein